MSDSCPFCRIVSGEIESEVVRQDRDLVAFRDINPQAPTHILVVPRRHISSLSEVTSADEGLMGKMILLATRVAGEEGLSETGYRLVINCGPEGGQLVPHLHLHLLGGRELRGRLG